MIISTQINPAEHWNIIYTADITLARHKVGAVLPTFKVKKYIFSIYTACRIQGKCLSVSYIVL